MLVWLQIIITAVGPKDSTYEQFLAALPENEPRFAGACHYPAPAMRHRPLLSNVPHGIDAVLHLNPLAHCRSGLDEELVSLQCMTTR